MLSSVLEKIAFAIIGRGWSHRRHLILYVRCQLPPREERVRFAFSSLVKLKCNDRVLLVRNVHRPECFSPPGGVMKYKPAALSAFDSWEVQFETSPDPNDMINDLRGLLPKKHLPSMLIWFNSSTNHESAEDCVEREMKEELAEMGLNAQFPGQFHFRHVRTVFESLRFLPNEGYCQHRIFNVLEPDIEHSDMRDFCAQLAGRIDKSNNFILATREEIFSGRSISDELIAPISRYLFSSGKVLESMPMRRLRPASVRIETK